MTRNRQCPPTRKSTRTDRHAKSRMFTRLRSKVKEMKKVRFQSEARVVTSVQMTRSAARSLFSSKSILELPNEMLSMVMTYCNAKELMLLRCVCRKFAQLIDNNYAIWKKVNFQNLWPTEGRANQELFARGVEAKNHECLVKLGLAHLYYYNLMPGAEKNSKEVKINASLSANYFRSLDNIIAPHKPITWMLIRPPWSSAKSICLKQAVHQQMMKFKGSNADRSVYYNIGKVLRLDTEAGCEAKAIENFDAAFELGCHHSKLENLVQGRSLILSDVGARLNWYRNLWECATTGNADASFLLCKEIASGRSHKFISESKSLSFFNDLFSNCKCFRAEKLECYQPKINGLMRCILVDWLAEVAYMKDMSHQILHAAVQYVDKFLVTRIVERTKLQLLGITCLLLAAKSHYDPRQVHILTVRESSWLTDQTYQYEDVVRMMGEIIGTFKGDLWFPTSWNYLDTLLSFPMIDAETTDLAHYLHDTSLQFTAVGNYKPSVLAASIVFLARIIFNKDKAWPNELAEYSGIEMKELVNCAGIIYFKSFTCPSIKDDRDLPLKSIKEEYISLKHGQVATIDIPHQNEIKNRILAADSCLSCISQDPLTFDAVCVDSDETLNMSVKSVDYDGDCEDSNDAVSDSSFEEESFCVDRTRLSSLHSVDEFTDDETTMDTEGLTFNTSKWDPKASFTPIFHSVNGRANRFESKGDQKNFNQIFFFPDQQSSSSKLEDDSRCLSKVDRGKQPLKRRRKPVMKDSCHVNKKRTRSSSNIGNL